MSPAVQRLLTVAHFEAKPRVRVLLARAGRRRLFPFVRLVGPDGRAGRVLNLGDRVYEAWRQFAADHDVWLPSVPAESAGGEGTVPAAAPAVSETRLPAISLTRAEVAGAVGLPHGFFLSAAREALADHRRLNAAFYWSSAAPGVSFWHDRWLHGHTDESRAILARWIALAEAQAAQP